MLADLKEKLAAVDRKRVYTAAAALLIAGAAGHFMQRTAGQGPAMMSASVPAPVPAPTAPATPALQQIADGTAPDVAPTAPAGEAKLAATAPGSPATAPSAETSGAVAEAAKPEAAPKPKPAAMAQAGMAAPEPDAAAPEVTRAASDPLMDLGGAGSTPDIAGETERVAAAVTDPIDMTPPTAAAPAEPMVAGCDILARAEAKPGALLAVTISAPCNSGETVAFEHAGLRFSEQLGPDGTLRIDVPAMTGEAFISLDFEDGTEKDLAVPVPDFVAYDRIALIWQGATGLQLHALEGGASYGEPGHVWADTPGTAAAATAGEGGFVSVLGSTVNGYAADVYTYPAKLMDQGLEPEVSIEAQVMETTCGGEIDGWILRSNPVKPPTVEPLRMVVPGCDAVGEYLVLKDLPIELKLARR